jgi:hypothetical protein
MGRAITEKVNLLQITNHTVTPVASIDHLPLSKKDMVPFQNHHPASSRAFTNPSTCTRCRGLMVNEFYMDLFDTGSESKFPPKRCVQCGEVVDFVILLNRQQSMQIQLTRETVSHNYMRKGQ